MKARILIEKFEAFAPKSIAEPNDPVGLQIGSLNQDVKKVMVTLDVRPEVVAEAIENQVDFIFSHHPLMFRPAKNLDLANPQNQMYADLLKHDIVVYSAHTNLDNAPGGMNDWLAQVISLRHTSGLVFRQNEPEYLLSIQVPSNDIDAVRLALAAYRRAGDSVSDASFQTSGISWFTPTDDQAGMNGVVGERTWADMVSLKLKVRQADLAETVALMKEVHPLANPSYEVVQLHNEGRSIWMGRVGELEKPMTIREFAESCKTAFDVKGLRLISHTPDKLVHRVAILGGSGGRFYPDVLKQQADVYVTGDISYHPAHDMLAAGLSVVDPGHHIESVCKPRLKHLFNQWRLENNWDIDITMSELNTDPFTFI
ncbi:dinuclear metal center protein, YbgI family [Secundilactobacillus oryzae JCM 18671]|uniref:GTP cyclohydrolase 1 type 2 homolog n=1 Tax=Secundilactobacillus oryzae JCM 18671 TaxID=1291743 RepID=A0A081BHB5_9LACO|nr:Nif3-like dinuclear metal center hexameric protein [Secundilactobacillus oryzae]GAK47433.1 dinuclear metal center protein, YbgI family [Secundilactobacillus oryzae JCM 18671]